MYGSKQTVEVQSELGGGGGNAGRGGPSGNLRDFEGLEEDLRGRTWVGEGDGAMEIRCIEEETGG